MTKRLHLKRESLAELTTAELQGAVGGLSGPTCVGQTCPAYPCLTNRDQCGNITYNC